MTTRALRCVLLLAAASALACASRPRVRVEGGSDALRSREGLCAATIVPSPSGAAHPVTIEACLRAGSPGTRFDNREGRLITVLHAEDPTDADLEDWQVLVLRDDERVLNRALDAGPSHRRCGVLGRFRCRHWAADVAPVDAGLWPGTYTLRYRLMTAEAYEDGIEPAVLTIVVR